MLWASSSFMRRQPSASSSKPQGKRINTARKERGLTSERLSEACGINATYLRQIESGAKVPSLQVFVLLCQALRVSPTYLLADALPDLGLQDMDALLELCRTATPKQLTLTPP